MRWCDQSSIVSIMNDVTSSGISGFMSQYSSMSCLECIGTTHASVREIQEGKKELQAVPHPKRRQTSNLKIQCLHAFISDRYTRATNGFYSALFSRDHADNCHTKVYPPSYNTPHFPTTRTQAVSDLVMTSKGLRLSRH